jgi:hypothetical protein
MCTDRNHETPGTSETLDPNLETMIRPLRQPESLSAAFEDDVMALIRAEMSHGRSALAGVRPAWWRRKLVLSVPVPVDALAAAAVLLVVFFAAHRLSDPGRGFASGSAPTAGVIDTVHVTQFVFVDPAARSVELLGDFNGWTPHHTALARDAAGTWTVTLPLPSGRHEYAFLVDGERWATDPLTPEVIDEFDVVNSVMIVAAAGSSL